MLAATVIVGAAATIVLILPAEGEDPVAGDGGRGLGSSQCVGAGRGLPVLAGSYEAAPIVERSSRSRGAVQRSQVLKRGQRVGVVAVVALAAPGKSQPTFLTGVEGELRAQGARTKRVALGRWSGVTTRTPSNDGDVIITQGRCQGYSVTAADRAGAKDIALTVLRADEVASRAR